MLGTTEIIIIAGIVVVLFGASAIPKIAKSIGQAKHEFNKGIEDGENTKTIKSDNSSEIK